MRVTIFACYVVKVSLGLSNLMYSEIVQIADVDHFQFQWGGGNCISKFFEH